MPTEARKEKKQGFGFVVHSVRVGAHFSRQFAKPPVTKNSFIPGLPCQRQESTGSPGKLPPHRHCASDGGSGEASPPGISNQNPEASTALKISFPSEKHFLTHVRAVTDMSSCRPVDAVGEGGEPGRSGGATQPPPVWLMLSEPGGSSCPPRPGRQPIQGAPRLRPDRGKRP